MPSPTGREAPGQPGLRDTEKRWHDPRMTRRATVYTALILAAAAATAAAIVMWGRSRDQSCGEFLCAATDRFLLSAVPTGVLLAGGIGAFAVTWRSWRAGRAWPIWQGAGWFLFICAIVYMGLSSTVFVSS